MHEEGNHRVVAVIGVRIRLVREFLEIPRRVSPTLSAQCGVKVWTNGRASQGNYLLAHFPSQPPNLQRRLIEGRKDEFPADSG